MKKVYIETYGCQMNVADTEVVLSVLHKSGYQPTTELEGADLAFMNTCAIRENAEEKIWNRLGHWKNLKKRNPDVVIGVLGCMAEHLRKDLLKDSGTIVDLVVGPDEYRKLPNLIDSIAGESETSIAVKLSRTETYEDILPFRSEGISAFISVMRGCDKFCTFCVVPFTRGRERSRSLESIVDECKELEQQGFREITLLGQNVNSYDDEGRDFSDLLAACARAVPNVRIRYTTSHPQDFDQKLVDTMAEHDNICKYIHLPIQSGSDRILKLMNRTYTREHYMSIVEMIRRAMPEAALSTDIIVGFCTETLEDHEMTKQVMREVQYEGAYTFNYSPRPNTRAWNTLADDVPDEEKTRRLQEIIAIQNESATKRNLAEIGREHTVLIEGRSKKNADEWKGRTDTNKMVIFPRADAEVGEYRNVRITRSNSATLLGELIDSSVDHASAWSRKNMDQAKAWPTPIYDLTPLVIATVNSEEHAGIQKPAVMELPVLS
ncbi:MAG TPA: tRNA (N6-isopentenyl adenosine(37)-C2)-methylthiotransferase MiaB [Candidatus Kapabacteria bacterium]|jgi:tRNA-2-methylthio-N6-dimethylallyladenosine synthase|nr:tRNA (N6-isopentenyl adenosine(37)-C2)-methylthiotransferase MiaB [Candidatus Kapabacteria bacterium]